MGTLTVCGWLEESEVKSTIHPRLKHIYGATTSLLAASFSHLQELQKSFIALLA